jgi:sugar phosphate isomerase/epimerase
VRFGISTHLFHGERLTREHLRILVDRGFDLVEVFATRTHFDYRDPGRVAELRGWLDELGMSAGSMHAPISDGFAGGQWGRPFSNASPDAATRREALDETRAAIDAAVRLGCASVVLHLGLPRGQRIPAGDNDARAVRRSLEALAEAAAFAGVTLAPEVIPNDLSTPDALLEFVGGDLPAGVAGVCLDFGHAHMLGGSPEAVETLSGHILTTHVHDNGGAADTHLVPFEGTIDWPATLSAVRKVGYQGALVFEVADHGDAAGVLERTVGARAKLQGILDELSAPLAFDEP